MTDTTPFLPGLSPLAGKPLTAQRDAGNLSSNGGLIVLRECPMLDQIANAIAAPLPETRNPLLITHSYADMVKARLLAIAAGYEDGDDLDHLRKDPALKIACGRTPDGDPDIASQPTISRLENQADARTLWKIAMAQIDVFCASFRMAPREIVLDIDDTDDLVHGGQQLALFNTHAGGYCFQPIHIFEANSGKPVIAFLRPGKRPSGEEIARLLRHVTHRIRKRWPGVRILVRGDGHYCAPEVLDFMRNSACNYILGLSRNVKLDEIAKAWREQCALRRNGKGKVRRMHQFQYRAESWSQPEKVIARVEATEMGSDARFIVTNLPGRGKVLYEKVYCARGRMENLIKDMKLYTRSDKTACHRWQANQFRLFLHVGAYWLLHSMRMAAPKRSRWRTATFATLRNLLLKIAVRVEEMKTRIKLSFPAELPHAGALELIAGRLGARGS
jgi:hypothetical protein